MLTRCGKGSADPGYYLHVRPPLVHLALYGISQRVGTQFSWDSELLEYMIMFADELEKAKAWVES